MLSFNKVGIVMQCIGHRFYLLGHHYMDPSLGVKPNILTRLAQIMAQTVMFTDCRLAQEVLVRHPKKLWGSQKEPTRYYACN